MIKKTVFFMFILFCAGYIFASGEKTVFDYPQDGLIHHFDFSGDLCDRVTGQNLYISVRDRNSYFRKQSRILLVSDSVQFVDTSEGESTAIKILPMEFVANLNWVDCPKLTVSMLLRFDGKDFTDKTNNTISWFETIYFNRYGEKELNPETKREYKLRKIAGEYHTDGKIESTGSEEGLVFPKDEWVRFTVVLDESAGIRIVYMNNLYRKEECLLPLDSMTHSNRVGIFHESVHCLIKGYISDLKIYDRALAEVEVARIHGVDSFEEYDIMDAYLPLFILIVVLTIIPLVLVFRKPWKLQRIDPSIVYVGDNNMAELEINEAINIWYSSSMTRNHLCSNSELHFCYPRAIKIPLIRKHIKNAINNQPSDKYIIERINIVVDAFNNSIKYRFNGSILYIIIVLASMFFQEAFQGTRTIFTSDDMTFWGAIVNTFANHWKIMLLLIPYIAFSMGWSLIGNFGKDINEEKSKVSIITNSSLREKLSIAVHSGSGFLNIVFSVVKITFGWMFSTIMWGIRNSKEKIIHKRNGTVVETSEGVNPAMFFGGFLVVAIILAVVYFIITFLAVFISFSPLIVIPYKMIRNYILHV